jgi:glycosyltransferase involved in cell wall biosynthesis
LIAFFANAIAAYVADPALRRAHGAAGEERSRAYSWDAINRVVAEAYLRIIAARKNSA